MKLSKNARNAIFIGSLCSISYLAVYIARNILSAVTPQMLEGGGFSEEYIAELSSVYLIFYAIGQLINGAIGDKIKARYMISFGLLLAGVTNLLFPLLSGYSGFAKYIYGCTGFFLAMIYGPMTKVVAENTEPIHATRCSLGYTFAAFFGSPLAGVLAAFLTWQSVFVTSSAALFLMATVAFTSFLILEKRGIVRYGQYRSGNSDKPAFSEGIKVLLKHRIAKFACISILTGVIRTSVVFWLPTFFLQYHGYSPKTSSLLFTYATFILSATPFLAVFLYERVMKFNMDRTILALFSASSIFFLLVFLIKFPPVNIALIVLAVMASNGAASMLWSRYCPSLRDTGMVSGATGFLDFLSYTAAAISNIIFANAATEIGWGYLILVWMGLMLLGVALMLPYGKILGKSAKSA